MTTICHVIPSKMSSRCECYAERSKMFQGFKIISRWAITVLLTCVLQPSSFCSDTLPLLHVSATYGRQHLSCPAECEALGAPYWTPLLTQGGWSLVKTRRQLQMLASQQEKTGPWSPPLGRSSPHLDIGGYVQAVLSWYLPFSHAETVCAQLGAGSSTLLTHPELLQSVLNPSYAH